MSKSDSTGAGDSGKQRPQVHSSPPAGQTAATAAESNRGDTAGRSNSGPTELPPQFGRYRVKKKLGGGGMGTVYLVENTELEREEALKVPHFGDGDDPQLRERFLREAKSAAKLDHANLCPVYDAGVQDGIYYLTMRFLRGKLLSDYTGKAQPARKAVEIATKLAQALEAAHAKGVIHRDLKPSNVMMVGGVGPVVMDFGLAKQVRQPDQKLTQAGSMLGTPSYMPPEQVNGDLERMGPPSDVYSLGVILYELLTGRLPFEGTVAAIFGQILYTEPPLPSALVPGLNPALDGICRKAMAKVTTERYPSMKAFAAALMDYLRSTPATEGAGNLVPAAVDKAAILQAPTAAPGPLPAGKADIFQAPTTVPGPSPDLRVSAMDGLRSVAQAPIRLAKEAAADVERPERKRHEARAKSRAALWLLIAGGVFAVLVAVSSLVVVRIATDNGELVIEADDANIEIVVAQGGKQVTIIDVQTKQQIQLASGTYELELTEGAEGLRLSTDKFTLTRGGREIVRVRRESVVANPPGRPPKDSLDQWFAVGTRWEGKAGSTKPNASQDWACWFTVRSREGNQFKGRLVGDGRRDLAIEGTLRDDGTSFRWTNARHTPNVWMPEMPLESITAEGKCTAERTRVDWKGTQLDGQVQEGFCEFTVRRDSPRKNDEEVWPPPLHPRRASPGRAGKWSVRDDELVQEQFVADENNSPGILFGDLAWKDYDFHLKAMRTAGDGAFRVLFDGLRPKKVTQWCIGNGATFVEIVEVLPTESKYTPMSKRKAVAIANNQWHDVRIQTRGQWIECFLDRDSVFKIAHPDRWGGKVGFTCMRMAGRFKDIEVKAPDGKVLWTGPPELPE